MGGLYAQVDVSHSRAFLHMFPVSRPEVIVPFAAQKFDAPGRLTDETTRKFVAQHVAELVPITRVLMHPRARGPAPAAGSGLFQSP